MKVKDLTNVKLPKNWGKVKINNKLRKFENEFLGIRKTMLNPAVNKLNGKE